MTYDSQSVIPRPESLEGRQCNGYSDNKSELFLAVYYAKDNRLLQIYATGVIPCSLLSFRRPISTATHRDPSEKDADQAMQGLKEATINGRPVQIEPYQKRQRPNPE